MARHTHRRPWYFRWWARAAGCVLLLAAACAHPSTTGKDTGSKDATATTQPGRPDVRAREVTPKTPAGHPPLAASPSELLEPEAREKVARALHSRGFVDSDDAKGEKLSTGLRKFQEAQGLAATGFPDHETVLRLGIDPKEVDKSLENFSGTKPGEAQADVSIPSDDAGKGGSGAPSSREKRATSHATPPSDSSGTAPQKTPDSSNTEGQ